MRRLPDWPARLAAAIALGRLTPFAWGQWDCCAAAAALVAAQTGGTVDLTRPFRWTTRAGATRTMRRYLGGERSGDALLEATVAARLAELGLAVVAPARAQRGDPVLLAPAPPWGMALGVVDLTGRSALTAATPQGWASARCSGVLPNQPPTTPTGGERR